MSTILWVFGATFLVSLISFVGVFTLSMKRDFLMKIVLILVAFAAGALIGVAFFDLIPEALESSRTAAPVYLVLGILIFFVTERFIGWHHSHHEDDMGNADHKKDPHDKQHHKPFIYTNLIADGIHNFLDGTLIAASFLTSVPLGIASTIAVALHEIPQEIGDFAILLHGGLSVRGALFFNFLSALTAIAGGLMVVYISSAAVVIKGLNPILLGIGGGGLLYLALTDILPEIHKETDWKKNVLQFILLLAGILIIYSIARVAPA